MTDPSTTIFDADGRKVAEVRREADASLVEKAPELRKALRAIIGDIESAEDLSDVVGRYISTEYFERARALIAKLSAY